MAHAWLGQPATPPRIPHSLTPNSSSGSHPALCLQARDTQASSVEGHEWAGGTAAGDALASDPRTQCVPVAVTSRRSTAHAARHHSRLGQPLPRSTTRRSTSRGSLTRVIFRKSKDGRGHRASSSRRRFRRLFFPRSTQGCERLRARPSRRPGSGMHGGVPTSARCSCDSDRRRREDSTQGPTGHQGGPELPPLPSTKPLLAEAGRGARGKVGPATGKVLPGDPVVPGKLALPPLWHRLLETRVQTLEPPGCHGDQQRASSSGSDRDRQCRLVGGAKGCPKLSLRSTALTAPRPVLGPQGLDRKGKAGPMAAWLPTGHPPLTTFQRHLSSEETGRRRDR